MVTESAAHTLTPSVSVDVSVRRVLLVTDRVPGCDIGNGIRVANVIEGLRRVGELEIALIDSSIEGAYLPDGAGFRTHRFRLRNPAHWADLQRLFSSRPTHVRYRGTRAARHAILESLGGQDWDVVWCSRARVHLLTDGVISGPRIVDLDDLNDRLLRSEIADRTAMHGVLRSLPRNVRDWLDVRFWSRLQRRIALSVDQVAVCSDEDRGYLAVPNCAVVPNGYPVPPLQSGDSVGSKGTGPCLLFVGALTYEPNRLGVEWFVDEVLPVIRASVPEAEFVVVGDHDGVDVSAWQACDVTFAGWVADVGDYYASARVAVVPLRSGGGTRVKVIEALARSVPLVSTSFGCAGHDLAAGDELLVADDVAEFADRCCELLTDASLCARVVDAGRRRYETTLTSETTANAVHQLAASIAANGDETRDRSTHANSHR